MFGDQPSTPPEPLLFFPETSTGPLPSPVLIPGEPWLGRGWGRLDKTLVSPHRERLQFEPSSRCFRHMGSQTRLKHQFHHQKVRLPVAAWPQAGAHTFVGGFSSALEPGNPFSVLSFPEELTRHSFLERERGEKGTSKRKSKSNR